MHQKSHFLESQTPATKSTIYEEKKWMKLTWLFLWLSISLGSNASKKSFSGISDPCCKKYGIKNKMNKTDMTISVA